MGSRADSPDYDGSSGYAAHQPWEDRALKAAIQFMGTELLPLLGVEGTVKRVAPTEQVHLEVRNFLEDFNYEMMDGTWKHLEFESDSITEEDLRRFRSYEAVAGYYYGVEVVTCVICSSRVNPIRSELRQGINVYRVQVVRLKDKNADEIIQKAERRQELSQLERQELVELLLTPLMDGCMSQRERIERSLKLLQREEKRLGRVNLIRMQSVLYALAMKFLNEPELQQIREVINMTVLGQMLMEDGMAKGMAKGMEKGVERVNRLNQELAKKNRTEDIIRAAADHAYQNKLFEEFGLAEPKVFREDWDLPD